MSDLPLIMPDTPEGRAIEQLAASIADADGGRSAKRQLQIALNLARVSAEAMVRIVGCDDAGNHFARLAAELHRRRGLKDGQRRRGH